MTLIYTRTYLQRLKELSYNIHQYIQNTYSELNQVPILTSEPRIIISGWDITLVIGIFNILSKVHSEWNQSPEMILLRTLNFLRVTPPETREPLDLGATRAASRIKPMGAMRSHIHESWEPMSPANGWWHRPLYRAPVLSQQNQLPGAQRWVLTI